ncbi:Uncharacterised protein [Alistipes sp. cv1]|nr:Uncharacterised protein [Faecalibacterium prausnitzii]
MLEAGRVGRVAGDRHVDALFVHYGHAFAHVVHAVAAHFCAEPFRVRGFLDDFQFARSIVELGLHIGETVDARDDQRGVLAQAVQDHAQRIFTHLVGHFGDLDCAFGCGERFVPGQECEALGLFAQQAGGQVAVSDAHFAIVGYRTLDAESLQADSNRFGCFGCVFATFFKGDRRAYHVSPCRVFEADRLRLLASGIGVDSLCGADRLGVLDAVDPVFFQYRIDMVDSAVVSFK